MPNYKLNRSSGDWDNNYNHRHFKVAKELGIRVSDMIIFEKNEIKKVFISKA
jgi:hypothetical protein